VSALYTHFIPFPQEQASHEAGNDRSPGISAYNAQEVLPLPSAEKYCSSLLTGLGFRAFHLPTEEVAGNLENLMRSQDETSGN
jgi:hypothetical protein